MTEKELKRTITSIGKECFVSYFNLFSSKLDIDEVVETLMAERGYAEKASRTRVNNARRIIREGKSKEVLQSIIDSTHHSISSATKKDAKNLLEQI